MNPRNLAMGGALLAGMAFASPLNAAIHIFNSPGSVQPTENLQFDGSATGQTLGGTTNNTDTSVTFQSLVSGVNLTSSSNGQARVEADGGALDSLRFFLTGGKSFGDVEFNLHKAATDTSSVTVTFLGSFGSETRTFDLKNGSNWIAASTDGGDLISAVLFEPLSNLISSVTVSEKRSNREIEILVGCCSVQIHLDGFQLRQQDQEMVGA